MSTTAYSLKWRAAVLLSLPLTTLAGLNDWSKACTNGECFYDLPAHKGQASGSVKIWGASHAISDITEVAGWRILGCDPHGLKQDIRLVCTDLAGCNHLYSKNGAVNKIVRLPENCGKNAFARVAAEKDSDDQNIPKEVLRMFAGQRGTTLPKVKTLSLDTDFTKVDEKLSGPVYVSLFASTIPNVEHFVPVSPRTILERGLTDFNKTFSTDLPTVDIDRDFTLFSKSIECGGTTASLSADAEIAAHVESMIAVTVVGTLIPPHLDHLGLFLGIPNATADANVEIKADAIGSIHTGVITLLKTDLPTITFHGIIDVSSQLNLIADVEGDIDLHTHPKLDLSFSAHDLKLFLPPSDAPASGGSFFSNSTLQLSVEPNAVGNAALTVLIMPQVNVDINVAGITLGNVALNINASASIDADFKPPTTGVISGCVKSDANLDAAAHVNLSNFINGLPPDTTITLYDHDFSLIDKCFGGATPPQSAATPSVGHLQRRLSCSKSTSTGNLIPVV